MGPPMPGVNPWMIVPFGLLLLAMALGPSLFKGYWSKHYFKVAAGLGLITLCYYVFALHAYGRVLETLREFFSFIVLIGSLFVVSGGIHLAVRGEAKPLANALFLLMGGLLANLLGTTGASMLLIRPWLRMNKYRFTGHHIAFFIFIVSNIGGCLTPIGDPPLFLGYLQGVPFWWVARRCWPMWLMGVGFLICIFYILDVRNYRRAPKPIREALTGQEQFRVEGLRNILWLAIILAAVFISQPLGVREALMLGAALGSYFGTPAAIHQANHFEWKPLREVAALFSGIFATMLPALDWLQVHAQGQAQPSPGLFYWASGSISSVLDNAPTYLSFLSALQGYSASSFSLPAAQGASGMDHLLQQTPFELCLLALSIGAVFFGATTYIGNGPNFMVKAIAEHQKMRTPGFFEFVLKYSLPCLAPLLACLWLLFFRR